MKRPSLLIENWLPIEEIGIESQRERGSANFLPPIYYLHVWWARRPLTSARASILASLLPSWSGDWPRDLKKIFGNEETYRKWFLELLGIKGNPIAAKKLLKWAESTGNRIPNPYGYTRSFAENPNADQLEVLFKLLEFTWGTKAINFIDPMAGGGSIPFEALRYGLHVTANELNPVASVILKATLDYTTNLGKSLLPEIAKYGEIWNKKVQDKLKTFFSEVDNQHHDLIGACYLWARTVICPVTGKIVPLSPNWWLVKGSDPVAVKMIADPGDKECRFEIVKGKAAERSKPDVGTISRGIAISPWTGDSIDGDYIKAEAQAGRMGQQLYALAIKRKGGFVFRTPEPDDLKIISKAENELKKKLPKWEVQNLIPDEDIPDGNKTSEPRRYGIFRWRDMFSPRQLLSIGTFVETLSEIKKQIREELEPNRAKAVITYLALAIDKTCDHNSRMARWESTRLAVKGTFDRHDFAFKWSHAEFDASRNLLEWGLFQATKSFREICDLVAPSGSTLFHQQGIPTINRLKIIKGNAASIPSIADGSVQLICVDPPYKANVMYAECSDFFYVWMKRTLGDVFPEFFAEELTDKDTEAVANVARYGSFKAGKRRELADRDYENKMAACFREMYRMLAPEGVLTVMFTHKEVSAWDALASALIGAGFTIHASWPIHTESEHSLHQAKKNAAASTIMLVCRKREKAGEPVWWDDLKGKVRKVARQKAEEFERMGIRGVDLYISAFGPALSIISESWPVLTTETDQNGDPKPLRPEEALDLAREEVVALRKRGLLLGRDVQFDQVTDWYLMAWDAFKAAEFPADEGRKLAIALGLSLEELVRQKKLVSKKQATVVLQEPTARRKKNMVDPDLTIFDHWIDAAHTAMLVYEEDGGKACGQFLKTSGLGSDSTFKALIEALLTAIPRNKKKGKFVRKEAETLENIRGLFFAEIAPPAEEEAPHVASQGILGFEEAADAGEDEDEGEEE